MAIGKLKGRKKRTEEEPSFYDGITRDGKETSQIEREFSEGLTEKTKSKLNRREIALSMDSTPPMQREIAAAPGAIAQTAYGQYGRRIPSSVSLIDRIQNNFLPQTNEEAITFAYNWYDKDDMLGDLIDIKTKFCINGMSLSGVEKDSSYITNLLTMLKKTASTQSAEANTGVEAPEVTEREAIEGADGLDEETISQLLALVEFNEKLENVSIEYNLDAVIEQLVLDFIITDTMILYWRTVSAGAETQEVDAEINLELLDTPIKGLIDINALHPGDIEWTSSLGQDEMKVKIPIALKARVKIALDEEDSSLRSKMLEGLIGEGVPQNLINAVEEGNDYYPLDREAGDNWIVVTRERPHHGVARPRMVKIFIPLATRLMNTEGEFAASLMMKHFIFHIKSGESITSGPDAGSTSNWTSQEECDEYMNRFKGVNKTTVIATNHTVEFNFIHPPLELFSPEKYVSSSQRILNFIGISSSLYTGEGGKYAGGYLSIKRLLSDISYIRYRVKKMIRRMFSSESMMETVEIPPEYQVEAQFSELHLKEQKQILDEVSELLERNMFGPRETLAELGRSPQSARFDRLVAMAEDKVSKAWGGTFYQPIQNNVENTKGGDDNSSENNRSKSRGGRPPNAGTTQNEETRNQSPTAE